MIKNGGANHAPTTPNQNNLKASNYFLLAFEIIYKLKSVLKVVATRVTRMPASPAASSSSIIGGFGGVGGGVGVGGGGGGKALA